MKCNRKEFHKILMSLKPGLMSSKLLEKNTRDFIEPSSNILFFLLRGRDSRLKCSGRCHACELWRQG